MKSSVGLYLLTVETNMMINPQNIGILYPILKQRGDSFIDFTRIIDIEESTNVITIARSIEYVRKKHCLMIQQCTLLREARWDRYVDEMYTKSDLKVTVYW